MTYKGHIIVNAAALFNVVSIKIVMDTKTNGTVPTALEMFSIRTHLGHRNIDNGTRFKVLDSKCLVVDQDTPFKCFESYIDLKKSKYNHTEYDGTTAAIADITAHPLYIVVMSSDTTNLASLSINHRYRYIDN